MSFCTVINCMDGRVQLPVIAHLQKKFGAAYVDSITEPGPNRILAEEPDGSLAESILMRLKISIEAHNSVGIAVVGHAQCAGNPTPHVAQTEHTQKAIRFLREKYVGMPIVGLWVDENWEVHELPAEA